MNVILNEVFEMKKGTDANEVQYRGAENRIELDRKIKNPSQVAIWFINPLNAFKSLLFQSRDFHTNDTQILFSIAMFIQKDLLMFFMDPTVIQDALKIGKK